MKLFNPNILSSTSNLFIKKPFFKMFYLENCYLHTSHSLLKYDELLSTESDLFVFCYTFYFPWATKNHQKWKDIYTVEFLCFGKSPSFWQWTVASVSGRYEQKRGRAFMKEISYDLRPITPNYVMMKAGRKKKVMWKKKKKHRHKMLVRWENEAIRNANGGQLVSVN